LLATYARAVAETLPLATPELQRLAVSHMHYLVAATTSATRSARAIADGRNIAAARLQAIMTELARISVSAICQSPKSRGATASHHGISQDLRERKPDLFVVRTRQAPSRTPAPDRPTPCRSQHQLGSV
jgi:hypothetical protein